MAINIFKKIEGKIIQVNGMVLPHWADNNHHFVAMNYLSLESRKVKESIPDWIDLIFGVYQHSKEKYNLFLPLTDQVNNV